MLKKKKRRMINNLLDCKLVLLKSSYKPIYYDLCPTSNNVLKKIKEKVNNKTRAIIYQHSFGKHDDISKLAKYCKTKKIFLIEDKALCFLSKKKKLKELQGDFAYYSFETSKTISTRMGGMLIFKKKNKYNLNYKNNFILRILYDLQTILSVLSYNIPGYLGFVIRKIFIIFKLLKKSIDEKDLDYNKTFNLNFNELTNFQKCLIILQLEKLTKKVKICNTNVKFWTNLIPDLKVENQKQYSLYYPVRLYYNGYLAEKIKRKIRDIGMLQDTWFEGGIGSRDFDTSKINFNIKDFKTTKLFCENYVNLPTLINLNKSFKQKVIDLLKN